MSFADQVVAWEQRMEEELLTRYRTDPALADGLALLRRTLRQTPTQPIDTIEVSAHALYRTFLEEGDGDVVVFAKQIATTNTHEEISANEDLILALAHMFGQQTATRVLPYIYHLKEEQAERQRASVLGIDRQTTEEVVISQQERHQGLYCIGVPGTGKTTLLANLIKKDLELGHGLCLIELHGDLTKTVLKLVPQHRLQDVILLDVMDSAFPFGLNLFQSDFPGDPNELSKTANFLMHLFEKVWNVGTDTPRLQQVLRNISRTLLANPGMTFAEIPLLLWDDTAREKLVSNVTNTQTQLFWQNYSPKPQRDKDELTASTMNKVDAYLSDPIVANIVSQANTSINFRRIMDESKILLIQLSPQLEEVSRLLGAAIIGRLLMATFSRTDLAEDDRRQFNFYVDEFQRFATSDWRTFLEEARKFNVPITFAHQSMSQLDESLQTAATGAGTIVVFRVSGEDSRVLAQSFDATPTQEQTSVEPIRRPVFDITTHLIRHGHTHPVVAQFTDEYLTRLDTLHKTLTTSMHPLEFCCRTIRGFTAAEGKRLLNDALFSYMETASADVFIHPLALFILSCAVGDGSHNVFDKHLKPSAFSNWQFTGLKDSAFQFGRADFLKNERAVAAFTKKHARKRYWDSIFSSHLITPGPAFIRMLQLLRQTMDILAKEPVLTDTGLYQPVYRQRTYADMAGEIANSLSQQENFTARVKTLTGEHTIRTNPLTTTLTEAQLAERIEEIKGRMREQGLCRPAHEVEEEVRRRHERLRERNDPPPPSHTNGTNRRRYRPRPPAHD
jgi:hypothetical protein